MRIISGKAKGKKIQIPIDKKNKTTKGYGKRVYI